MFIIILCFFVSLILVFILKLVSMFIAERVVLSREELSSYECGFEHHNVARIPISLRYFFLTLLFLLFDLEVVLLLFLPTSTFLSPVAGLVIASLFLVFLLVGLVYE
jgi:NADH-ubiquinone oxidoreductase chain 3